MADQSLYSLHQTHRGHGPGAEYRLYFAVIFLASVPFAAVKWAIGLTRVSGTRHNPGIVDRALSEARAITPMIFSA